MSELTTVEIKKINIKSIEPNPFQPRKEFEEEGMKELMESIRHNGLIQRISVIPKVDQEFKIIPDQYVLIAGERRWRATSSLYEETGERKYSVIEAIVDPLNEVTPATYKQYLMLHSLAENLNRKDLSPIEKAEAIEKIKKETGMTYSQIGESLGMNEKTIKNIMTVFNKLTPRDRKTAIKEKIGRPTLENFIKEKKSPHGDSDKPKNLEKYLQEKKEESLEKKVIPSNLEEIQEIKEEEIKNEKILDHHKIGVIGAPENFNELEFDKKVEIFAEIMHQLMKTTDVDTIVEAVKMYAIGMIQKS